jgi:pimeloyl-ACP methyl ester carboxylesterase
MGPVDTAGSSGLITRRRVIAGGAATAAAMASGSWLAIDRSSALRRRLHERGLLAGPDLPVPSEEDAGDVVYSTFDAADGHAYAWGLWTPPLADVELCLVCLHGKGGDERFAFEDLGVHRFVAHAGLAWAVATIDGGTDYWHRRASGHDPQTALTAGLLPALAERLGPAVRFAALGWSMGGYGVLLLAERNPDPVAAVVAASPAIWTRSEAAAPGAFDNEGDFRANDVLADAGVLDGMPVRIDCGADDVFAGTSRRLLDTVPGSAGGIHPGFHDSGTWRSLLPAQLRWISDVMAPRDTSASAVDPDADGQEGEGQEHG